MTWLNISGGGGDRWGGSGKMLPTRISPAGPGRGCKLGEIAPNPSQMISLSLVFQMIRPPGPCAVSKFFREMTREASRAMKFVLLSTNAAIEPDTGGPDTAQK